MDNILELKTINELCQFAFFVPSYQRGYRWTSQEVNDLLNDIHEFKPRQINDTDEKTWYCLQPVVLKSQDDGTFEVIDGQQRLTTIFLILQYLNQDFVEARRDALFTIDYKTREDTKRFLLNIENTTGENLNIDHFHVYQAYQTISKWFSDKGLNFNKDDFRSKFKFNTKVIWYECVEQDSISVFTRLNIGKISLTNSELIKALFLSSSNHDATDDKLRQKQLEIATEWDNIENALQDDKFWCFLTNKDLKNNRIEFIFDLMNEDSSSRDQYATFRYFSNIITSKSTARIESNWREIKDRFQRFREWYDDRELYHKIGYLLSTTICTINDLLETSTSVTKLEFKKYLDDKIKTYFKKITFSDLQYPMPEIKPVLLLYNILTMLQNSQDGARFPFDMYKNKKSWDVEHINSVKDSIPEKNRRVWLMDAKPYIDNSQPEAENLLKRINTFADDNESTFTKLFEDILAHFSLGEENIDDNGIANLALLGADTNRSYKNEVFPIKRKTIIEKDKSGDFIPLCTKNVFLKYFSEYPPKISFWTQDDRMKYDEDLRKVLNDYVSGCME